MSSEITTPPLEPYLIPESPRAEPGVEPAIPERNKIAVLASINSQTPPQQPAIRNRLRRAKPEKFTLAQAFDYFFEPSGHVSEDVNLERAVRAVGFLLHWCSNMGNDSIEGNSAHGLGHILEFTADQITQTFEDQRRELAKLRDVVRHLSEEKLSHSK